MTQSSNGDRSPYPSPAADPAVDQTRGAVRPLLLTVREAAELVGVGRTTIYKLIGDGTLVSLRIGSSRRVPLSSIHAYVDRLCASGNASTRGASAR
jgi:excisionase family DNA binding protein